MTKRFFLHFVKKEILFNYMTEIPLKVHCNKKIPIGPFLLINNTMWWVLKIQIFSTQAVFCFLQIKKFYPWVHCQLQGLCRVWVDAFLSNSALTTDRSRLPFSLETPRWSLPNFGIKRHAVICAPPDMPNISGCRSPITLFYTPYFI